MFITSWLSTFNSFRFFTSCDDGIAALSVPGVLPNGLSSLNLKDCRISHAGAAALSRAPLPNLKVLVLADNNDLGDDGIKSVSLS